LLFDFDGTIAETERDGHRVAYNRAFEDLGLPWHWSVPHYGDLLAIAGGKERIAHFIATEDPPRPAGDPKELAQRIHLRKAERFAELAPAIAFRPGVARLVAEAKREGLKLGVATTAAEAGVRAVLGNDPATLEAFDVLACGDVVPNKKPAPDIYLHALSALGVAPSDACAFEDTELGLAAARAARVPALVTPSVYSKGERFPDAFAVLTSLGDDGERGSALHGPEPPEGLVTLAYLRRFFEADERA
jgi:HAD superfamily hydrolase (TIGR01509 family)